MKLKSELQVNYTPLPKEREAAWLEALSLLCNLIKAQPGSPGQEGEGQQAPKPGKRKPHEGEETP